MTEENKTKKFPKIKNITFDPPGRKFSGEPAGTVLERTVYILPHPAPYTPEGEEPSEELLPSFNAFNLHFFPKPTGGTGVIKTTPYDSILEPPEDNIIVRSINMLFSQKKKKADIPHLYPKPQATYQVLPIVEDVNGDFVPDMESLTHAIPDTDETVIKPLLMDVNPTIHKAILDTAKAQARIKKCSIERVFHNKEPMVFNIKRTKTGDSTTAVSWSATFMGFLPIPEEVTSIMDNRFPLTKFLRLASEDEQYNVLNMLNYPIPHRKNVTAPVGELQASAPGEIPAPTFNTTVPEGTNAEAEALQTQLTDEIPF